MFAIPGIVLLLVLGVLRPQELVVELQALPLFALFCALALFGLAVDYKLRKAQLAGAPQVGWALAFFGWAALSAPHAIELALPLALFLSISQGAQSFRAIATLAATLLVLSLALAAAALRARMSAALAGPPHVAGEPALTLAVIAPLAFAYFSRKRSVARLLLLLSTVVASGLCVILTQSRPLVVARGRAADAPELFLSAALLYVSFKIVIVILRNYSDDGDAAVARTWARALLASLVGLSAGLLFFSFRDHVVFWIFIGLTGALYQATRAHDDKLEIRFHRRDLFRVVLGGATLWAFNAVCL